MNFMDRLTPAHPSQFSHGNAQCSYLIDLFGYKIGGKGISQNNIGKYIKSGITKE